MTSETRRRAWSVVWPPPLPAGDRPGLEFLIVVPCYNAARWIARCLASVATQSHERFRCLVVDDASSDGTLDVVRRMRLDDRFAWVRNPANIGPLANAWTGLAALGIDAQPDAVGTILDGDDWYAHPRALATIAAEYAGDPRLLMTSGNLARSTRPDHGLAHPPADTRELARSFRARGGVVLSPRTFRGRLWRAIREVDLRDPRTRAFWHVAGDVAFLLPLIEMAAGRVAFIGDILYIYNQDNPLSDFRTRARDQHATADRIRHEQRPYGTLEEEEATRRVNAAGATPRRGADDGDSAASGTATAGQ